MRPREGSAGAAPKGRTGLRVDVCDGNAFASLVMRSWSLVGLGFLACVCVGGWFVGMRVLDRGYEGMGRVVVVEAVVEVVRGAGQCSGAEEKQASGCRRADFMMRRMR